MLLRKNVPGRGRKGIGGHLATHFAGGCSVRARGVRPRADSAIGHAPSGRGAGAFRNGARSHTNFDDPAQTQADPTARDLQRGGQRGPAAGGTGANSSSTTVRNASDNKFWATLEKNIKDILHETDKVLPTGAPQPSLVQALTGAPGSAPPAPTAPNVSFREAAAVMINAEAGLVIVRATSRQHEKIQEFLDQVLANAKRQVLIEATIAEVQLNNQYQQGIDWTALRTRGLTTISGNQISSGNVTTTPQFPPGITVTPPGALPRAPAFPNLLTLAVSRGTNIAGVLQLLESFGTVRYLSSPKLSVLNNQTALLRVVDTLVY